MSLKPCPFCGAEAILDRNAGDYGYRPSSVFVRCSAAGCFAKTHIKFTEEWTQDRGHYSVEKAAIATVSGWWNQRAA